MDLTINKIAAGVVGLAMVAGLAFAFTASQAHAISLSELVELFIALEVIPADKADEARAVLDGQEEEAPAMACEFTRDLTTGDTGADVMDLQKLLNANGFTVSASGAGSAGMETEYFGPATAGAVAAMQEAFAADILTPLGLTAGTGYFGASTRDKANELCGDEDMPDTPDLPDEDDEDMDEDEDDDMTDGEASYGSLTRSSSPSSVEVSEGDEEVEVAGFEFDVDDADAMIKRVYVSFEETSAAANSVDPWDYFDAVQLFVNGDMVDEMATDDEDDWEDISGTDRYELRFTGLSEVIDADTEADVTFGVTVHSIIDSADEDAVWTVSIRDNDLRMRDGAGIDETLGDNGETRDFSFEAAGQDEELKIKSNSSNPDSSIIKVDTNSDTDDAVILVFDLEAEEADIEIREFPILLTTDDNDIDDVVSDVVFEVDGESMGDIDSNGVGTTTTFEFDNNDFIIDEGDTVTVKIIVDLKDTSDYAEGTTLSADVTSTERDAIDAEGTEDLANGDKSGTAVGETHQLQSEGIFAEIVSVDETSKSDGTVDDAVGEFEIKFDVTAFEDTYYISATTTTVFDYDVEDADGTASTTLTAAASAAVSSTADREGDSYRIDEDQTETFTLTVTVDPAVAGFYRAQLNTVDFGDSSSNTTNQTAHTAAPTEDFETGNLYLNV